MSIRKGEPAKAIRRMLKPEVTPEPYVDLLNQQFTAYQCDRCQEQCINPEDSVLHEAGTCLECHVHYAAHGHVRKRISSRWY